MSPIVFLGALVWCAIIGIILLCIGWIWTGLIMVLVPIFVVLWLLGLGDAP